MLKVPTAIPLVTPAAASVHTDTGTTQKCMVLLFNPVGCYRIYELSLVRLLVNHSVSAQLVYRPNDLSIPNDWAILFLFLFNLSNPACRIPDQRSLFIARKKQAIGQLFDRLTNRGSRMSSLSTGWMQAMRVKLCWISMISVSTYNITLLVMRSSWAC